MSAREAQLSQMMKRLTEEDYLAAMKYVEFLISARKSAAKKTLRTIQGLFADDKGWESEADMLKDMAAFRRSRTA